MTSIIAIYRRFPTKESCIEHLETVRWKGKPHCPYCKSERVSKHTEQDRRSRWQCSLCRKSFSVTVGTIFHNSHVDLQRWFLLISLMFSAKKGLSALQAARDLEMRSATVWSMMHRIRKAMMDDGKLLAGIVHGRFDRCGMRVLTDEKTGTQYLVTEDGGIIKRDQADDR